jgi:predicted negative regulator of RcsB-dependent stress response
VDRLTRHDLKTDKFVEEFNQTIEFVGEHKSQLVLWGSIALAMIAIAGGTYYYMKTRREARQQALAYAIRVYNSVIDTNERPGTITFPTEAAREQAITQTLTDLATKYSGSEEAGVANYLLGINAADQGKLIEARRYLQTTIDEGGKDYGSLAKLSLAEILAGENKLADAEKLLRGLMANPTILVSKDQATLELARLIMRTRPNEARQLLEPLRTESGAAGQVAIDMLTQLTQTP